VATITLAMSEAVTVRGGTPSLTLSNGGTAVYDAAQSSGTSLVFDYAVGARDAATSSLAVTSINLNAATVLDAAGNGADLSGGKTALAGSYINVPFGGADTITTGANALVNLGNGADTVTAGAGSVVTLGNGSDRVTTGDRSIVIVGSGADTVRTGAFSLVSMGSSSVTGSGSVTAGDNSIITVGKGAYTITAGANSVVATGSGNDSVFAGANDFISLGVGANTVGFGIGAAAPSLGHEVVAGFGTNDVLLFNHILVANFAAAMTDAKQVGMDTVIATDANNSVTLQGVALSSLTSSNFRFA
jgi:hypothetical protein